MKSKSDKIGLGLIIAGIVLICSCLVLWAYNNQENLDAQTVVSERLPEIIEAIEKRVQEEEAEQTEDGVTVDMWYYPLETDSSEQSEDEEEISMSTIEVSGYDYIGYLSFPELYTDLPILAECDYTRLKLAPCRYSGSYNTDNLVIAAHNYKSSFGKLKQLVIGDEVNLTDMDGVVHKYKVADIEVLEPDEVKRMIQSDWPLSLYTCTYDGSQRYTVRCEKSEE